MINIPIKPSLRGKFRWELIDERTGKVKDKSDGYVKNKILNRYLNSLFTDTKATFLNWSEYGSGAREHYGDGERNGQMNTLHIGSGTTPVSGEETSLESPLSTSPDKVINFDRSVSPSEFPVWVERQFTFNAGNGTGTINEIGTYSYGLVSRKILDTPIEKTSTDKLIVYYRYEFDIPTRHFSGTITGGQRDGTTDINWDIYITDDMVYNCWCDIRKDDDPSYAENHNPLCGLIDEYNNFDIYIGDSNTASDIQNDSGGGSSQLKGSSLYSGKFSYYERNSYISDSFQKSARLGFEENVANVQISEMILFPLMASESSPLARITFDPPLDNVANFRLYFDFTVSLGSAT